MKKNRHLENLSAALHGRTLVGQMDFCVPLLPPSVNHYKKPTARRGHIEWYVTDEAKAFIQAVGLFSRNESVRFEKYYVEIYLNLGPKARMDVDNCAKVVLDSLAKCGIIHSDAFVTDLAIHKRRAPESRTCITIWEPSHSIVQRSRAHLKEPK